MIKHSLIAFILLFFVTNTAGSQATESDPWQTLVDNAIWYRKYTLKDPFNNVYVARMRREAQNVTLESAMGQGKISSGSEKTSSQVARYDGALNNWPWQPPESGGARWGARNKVIVAINGSYVNSDGSPQSGQVHSGWYAKRFTDNQSTSGVVWKDNRELFIGGLVTHPANKQMLSRNDIIVEFDGLNRVPGSNEIVLFTSQYGDRTPALASSASIEFDPGEAPARDGLDDQEITDEFASLVTSETTLEMVVEMRQPASVSLQSDQVSGKVLEFRSNSGSTPILFDRIVVFATGTRASELQAAFSQGDELYVAQKINDNTGKDWVGAFSAVQNDYYFLRNGVIYPYNDNSGATTRAPRTAIVFNQEYVYFIVVDGRDPGISYGMTIAQLGAFALNELGAVEGAALDGGGSSTMVINGKIVNFPSDGVKNPYGGVNPKPHKNLYIPLVQGGVQNPVSADPLPIVERGVPNSLLMVQVEQPQFSSRFTPGQTIKTTGSNLNIRQGPGTNYASLGQISTSGTAVVVADNGNGMNGVWAKGYYWWIIKYGDLVGWAAEAFLTE
jgi:hypothetical protein